MSVILINPNATRAMTEGALEAARAAAPGLALEGWTSHKGPAAIQGEADGEAATGPLLDLVDRANGAGAQGIILACFDDTGLAEARARSAVPVIGIGQAAYTLASLISDRFAVITTTRAALPVLRANIEAGGFAPRLVHLAAADLPVLDLESDPEGATQKLRAALPAALKADPGVIVLGCAGMGRVIDALRGASPVPVIDGVSAAARLMGAMLGKTG